MVPQRQHSGRPDRRVGLACPPRPAHRVGDDHAHGHPEPGAQRLAQPPGGLVRVLGKQHHRAWGSVGRVHPGGGEHEPLPGLRDRRLAAPGHHPDRLRGDRVLAGGGDDAALSLADHLRGDHQDVAGPQARTALGERRVGDQPRHVVSRRDLRYPGDTGNVDLCRAGGHRFSSSAKSIAPCAIAAAEGRSRMYSGSARTAMPASAGSSAAALSCSSTSQPSMRSAP